MEKRIILGIVGTHASGKDTMADYLVRKFGFVNLSTGDMVREYIKENNLGGLERENLQKVANNLRKEKGPDYLVRKALENSFKKLIISGVRAVPEAEAVRDSGGFIVSCDAPIEERYSRIMSRRREGDKISFEQFKKEEKFEMNPKDKNAQDLPGVMALADYVIINDSTLSDLERKTEEVIEKLI